MIVHWVRRGGKHVSGAWTNQELCYFPFWWAVLRADQRFQTSQNFWGRGLKISTDTTDCTSVQ